MCIGIRMSQCVCTGGCLCLCVSITNDVCVCYLRFRLGHEQKEGCYSLAAC